MYYAKFISTIIFICTVLSSTNLFAADNGKKYTITKDVSTQGAIIEPIIYRKPTSPLKSKRTQGDDSKKITKDVSTQGGIIEPIIVRKPTSPLTSKRTQGDDSKPTIRKVPKKDGVLVEPTALD